MRIMGKVSIICFVVVMALTSTVLASSGTVIVDKSESTSFLQSSIIFNETPASDVVIRREKVELKGIDATTGRIVDEEALKKSLLEYFNSDLNKFSESIKNIDSIVSKIKASNETRTSSISPQTVLFEGWSKEPQLSKSETWVRYTVSWLTEDNYRSSVPIRVTITKESEVTQQIGFSGDVNIKVKFNFSASYTERQKTTISQGAEIPAWTVWGTRPYIKYRSDTYSGEYYVTIFNGSYIETIYETKTGTNNVLLTKSNEYWSRENTTKNINATTPSPPSGAPNV